MKEEKSKQKEKLEIVLKSSCRQIEKGNKMEQKEDKQNKGLPKMLTTKEVMQVLKIGRTTLYRYMERGKLKAYRFGRDPRFKEEDIKAFIEAHEKK